MGEYTAVNGTKFTDTDIEGWAAEAESEQGYTGAHLGPSAPGRSVSVGAEARPLTIRLDAARRAKLTARAEEQHTSVSQLVRDLIDAL